MIASYIQELLSENNRVIVPGFGAFLVRATSKYKSATDLSKKLNDIYFSPFLKFNDELLVNYIIKKEDISKDEAIEKINDFTERIKKDIEKGESFEIKDFGVFAIEEGKIQFTPATKAAKTTKEKEPTKVKEEAPKETKKQPEPKKTDKTETQAAKTTDKAKPAASKPATSAQEKSTGTGQTPTKTPVPPKAPQSTAAKAPPLKAQKEKKYNKGLVLALAIGIPAAVLFVLLLLNLDTVTNMFSKDKEVKQNTEKVATTNDKTTQKKTTEKKTKEEKEATAAKKETSSKETKKTETKTSKPAANVKKYYVIAGSFEKESNASRYQQSLIKKGYKAEMLPERNGMYAVSFSSFADKKKAMAELNYLTKEEKLQAWLLYY